MKQTEMLFRCGACRQLMCVADELAGHPVRCPHCKKVVQAPALSTGKIATPATEATSEEAEPLPAPISAAQSAPIGPSPTVGADELFGGEPITSLELSEPTTSRADAETPPPVGYRQDEVLEERDALGVREPPRFAPRAQARLPISTWLLVLLIPYSAAITALWVVQRQSERPPHPLEALADQGLYEEFEEGRSKTIADPQQDLSPDVSPLKLGETRRFGGLEVTPLDVRREKLRFTLLHGKRGVEAEKPSLVLRLRLKNVSDIVFHPNDPTFNRGGKQGVFTYLEIGDRRFYGPVKDPAIGRVGGQHFGELLPNASMETLVATHEADGAVEAMEKLQAAERLTWRVQLRKGREEITLKNGKKRLVWLTTVVPVIFTPADVK